MAPVDGALAPPPPDSGLPDSPSDVAPLPGLPDAEPPSPPSDPCEMVSCSPNERCEETSTEGETRCVCESGYVDLGAGCVTPPMGDPESRTAAEVCSMWAAGNRRNATALWTGDRDDRCDLGVLDPIAIDDTVRRINLFRWLSGLGLVTNNPDSHRAMQECAVMQGANPDLSHAPPSSWDCYTTDGANAAGRANLSKGRRNPADTVNAYMYDLGVSSLGHRRWLLHGPLGRVGVGFRGLSGCLGVFDRSGTSARPWVAYPNPGYTPSAIASHRWSVQGNLPGSDVQVTRLSDGADLPVIPTTLRSGIASGSTIAIDRDGWNPETGERYRVVITGSRGRIEYTLQPVDCG